MINTHGTPEFGVVEKSDQPRDKSGRWTKGGTVRRIREGMPEDMRHMGEEAFWDGYKVMTDLGKNHEIILDEKETHEFDPHRIWTLVDEEDGSVTAEAGFTPGSFGYLVTKHQWKTGNEKGTYSEPVDDFDDDVSKIAPRDIPAVAGAHWTVAMSRVADRIEPYAARRRKPIPRPVVDRHLPTVKRIGGKLVQTGRQKAAETARAISYDLSSLNDKDKLIREVATGQGRVGKSWVPKAAGAGNKARTATRFFEGQYKPATSLSQMERNQLRNHISAQQIARDGLKGARIRRDPSGALNRVTVHREAFPGANKRAVAYAERSIKRKGHRFAQGDFTKRPKSLSEVLAYQTSQGTLSPVTKSFIPGVGWKPIVQATAKQRARIPGAQAAMHRVSPRDRTFARGQRELAANLRNSSPKEIKDQLGGVKLDNPFAGMGIRAPYAGQGVTFRTGSAKRGKSYTAGQATTPLARKNIQAHEDVHAGAKRSSYRLHGQIMRDKNKMMREEARADYFSQGHYDKGRGWYADASRSREKALKHPNRPGKGSKAYAELLQMGGHEDVKRFTNRDLFQGHVDQFTRTNNSYKMSGRKAERAVDAYRDLQNHLRAKGVPERGVQKSLGARLGAEYTVRMLKAAERIEPKPPVKVPKGKLKPISRARATVTQTARKAAHNKLVRTATNPVHLFKDNEFNEQNVLLFKRYEPAQKSFQPWDGVRAEVSKMGPDQSELHVAGDSNQRRGKRLRKLPPDAVRRTR